LENEVPIKAGGGWYSLYPNFPPFALLFFSFFQKAEEKSLLSSFLKGYAEIHLCFIHLLSFVPFMGSCGLYRTKQMNS